MTGHFARRLSAESACLDARLRGQDEGRLKLIILGILACDVVVELLCMNR